VRVCVFAMAMCLPVWADGFPDEFDGRQLPAHWEWWAPAEGPSYSLTESPGSLRITVPQRAEGYSHWVLPPHDAPMLIHPIDPCDFTLEAHLRLVEYGPTSQFHAAIVAGTSRRNVMALGPFFGPGIYPGMKQPEVWVEPTGQGRLMAALGEATDVWLRIDKTRMAYTFSIKHNTEEPWREIGEQPVLYEPRLVGFMGKTFTGGPRVVVDIDSIQLSTRERTDADAVARVTVDGTAPRTPINPDVYGYFTEHLGRCIYQGGLWAEKVRNRKFAGNAGPDGALAEWRRFGPERGVELARENVVLYTGAQSQRITSYEPVPSHGVAQDSIDFTPGEHPCRIVLRQRPPGSAAVRLWRGDTLVDEVVLNDVGSEWRTYESTLDVPTEGLGTLAITSETSPGRLWVGAVSLMPPDAVDGIRRDLIDAIRALRPPAIRWPGGNFASGYHWQDGIGDRDRRPAIFDRAWNTWDTNDFGTHELIRFCELVGATPYICLNLGEGDADEAAAWVEYCNGAGDTRWGALRTANGAADPFDVRIWGLGNEMWGEWQLGHLPAETYALKAVDVARAVRAVDPDLRLIGSGVDGHGYADWNARALDIARDAMDDISFHFYLTLERGCDPELNYALSLAAPRVFEHQLQATEQVVAAHEPPGRRIGIAVDEWNTPTPDTWNAENQPEVRLREGIFAARMLQVFQRHADRVTMANIAALINAMGVIQTDQTHIALTPVYHVFRLLREYSGPLLATASVEADDPIATMLGVSATVSEDGRTTYVSLVNPHPSATMRVSLSLGVPAAVESLAMYRIAGDSPAAANALRAEPEVVTQTSEVAASALGDLMLPPLSVTVVVVGPTRNGGG